MTRKRKYRTPLALPAGYLEGSECERLLIEMKRSAGRWVRAERMTMAMSQTELARRIGTTQRRISRFETNDAEISLDFCVRAVLALDPSIDAVFEAVDCRRTGAANWIRKRAAQIEQRTRQLPR